MPLAIVIIAIVVVLALWFISLYNGIVQKDNRCDNAWQTIDAQLQRRNDLIPNLVETVKGYAAHESKTLEAVTQARSAVMSATTPEGKMEASNILSGTLKSLFAVAEAYPDLKANTNFQQLQAELSETYPDLKANTNFQQLQAELSETENKIVYARQSFNDCVLEYNNAIETFPGNIVAGSKFKMRQGFEVTDASVRQAPQVKF